MTFPDDDEPTGDGAPIEISGEGPLARSEADGEPPVVARMMIEIRSDGSTTIARGAMEELESGQTVAIEARGDSPMQLAWSLAKMIASTPTLARTTARALLPAGSPGKPRRSRVRRLVSRLRRGRGGARDDDDR